MDAETSGAHPARADLRLPKVLAALADPARLSAVRTLGRLGESPCTELLHAADLDIGRSTFSHHQKVLREAGILHVEIRGAQRVLTLRRNDLDACFPGLLDSVLTTADRYVA